MTSTSVYTFLHLYISVYIWTYLSLILSLSLSFNAVGTGWGLRRGKNQHPKQHGHLRRGIVRLLCSHCRLNMFIIICIHVCMYRSLRMSSALSAGYILLTLLTHCTLYLCITYLNDEFLTLLLRPFTCPFQCSTHTPCFSHVLLYLLIYYILYWCIA